MRGMTLIEIVIVLVILGILLGIGARACSSCERTGPSAHAAAGMWAQEMGYKVQNVSCASTDSDGNGYVSCTLKTAGDQSTLISLECASGWAFTEGCRLR